MIESLPLTFWPHMFLSSPGYNWLSGYKFTLLAHAHFFIHQYPQVLLSRATLNPFVPKSVAMLGIAFLNFMRFTWSHFSSLSRSFWMASFPSRGSNASLNWVSFANLLRVHSNLTVYVIDEDIK